MIRTSRISRTTFLAVSLVGIVVVIIGLGLAGYLDFPKWESLWATISKLPAKLPAIISPISETPTETAPEAVLAPVDGEQVPEETEAKKYVETAQKGEGLTHLARRVLKAYLAENPQEFKVTPEHKIYIEDYLAKKMGGGWLKLGEKVEFSEELIKEALQKAEKLTPQQLENLTQYSQLVPSLIY